MTYTIHLFPIFVVAFVQNICLGQVVEKRNLYVGQSAMLKCGTLGQHINIPLTYRWEKPRGNIIGRESILSLKNVDFKDGGTYTCIVNYDKNGKTTTTTLTTQLLINKKDSDSDSGGPDSPSESPTIRFSDPNQDFIELTETGFLKSTCTVNNWANSDYVAQWMKFQRVLNGGSNELFLFPLDIAKDSGTYTCLVYHKMNPEQKYERELRVNILNPEIRIESMRGEDLRLGGRIYRKCQVSNGKNVEYEKLTYTWFKDNSIIVSTSNTLDIAITDASVVGQYSCFVNSLKGEKRYTQNTQITFGSEGPPTSGEYKISIYTQPMSPELNKPFQFSCQVFPPYPNLVYQWMKGDRVISSQPILQLPEFRKEDIGSYSCKVADGRNMNAPVGRTPPTSVDINFMYSSENKIELSDKGTQLISRAGEKRELHCELSTSSNSRGRGVQWFFKGRPIDDAMKSRYEMSRYDGAYVSILTLIRISSENEGQYRCEVDGLRKSTNLVVFEEQTPINMNPPQMIVDEGEEAEFHCRVNNVPGFKNTQMRWSFKSRDGRRSIELEREPRWVTLNSEDTAETSFINNKNSRLEDDGFYTCMTPAGKQMTAELIVRPKKDKTRNTDNIVLTITPETLRVRENQPIIIECFSVARDSGQPTGDPKFSLQFDRNLRDDSRFVELDAGPSRKRLSIPRGLSMSDSGIKVECRVGDKTKTSIIYLENECAPNFRRCNNGDCQPSGKFCDGVRDCPDGSDEIQSICNKCDPISVKCEYNDGKMPIKNIFLVHWRCDGENDCGNNFDESKCTEDDKRCNGMNFSCSDGKVIPRAYQCDRESDCTGGDDESGCVIPQIKATQMEKVRRVRRGDSVKLTCESDSNPRSHILWRHNWGCLKDTSRMYVSNTLRGCSTVMSVLTITNFQPGDDGIYNCEALSAQNRAFSEDLQLILENF